MIADQFYSDFYVGTVQSIPLLLDISEDIASSRTNTLACCIGSDIISCKQADLNPKAIGADQIELPGQYFHLSESDSS